MKNINFISNSQIKENKNLEKFFKFAFFKDLNIYCSILNGNFYIDSHNYYPIMEKDLNTFPDQFDWQNKRDVFSNKDFKENFFKNKKDYKEISNAFILGTSPGNNHYRNIWTFLIRLNFITEKEINLAIHRNTSNNVRNFIKFFLNEKKIKVNKYIYLDDGFYFCKNSQIPSFLKNIEVIKFYEYLFPSSSNNKENIYISRRNAKWRQVVNETDFLSHLEKEGFEILEFENLSILEQIKKIQKSKKIIAPHGSGLTNLLFGRSNSEIQVVEIVQNNIDKELNNIYLKYKEISEYKKNQHYFFGADLAGNDLFRYIKTRNLAEGQHIGSKNIRQNPYFKNFIVQEKEFKKLITNFHKR